MFNCRYATERASALLDGQLSTSERWALRLHLMMCHHCRRYLAQLRLTVATVRRLTAQEPVFDAEALARQLRDKHQIRL